MSAERRAEIEAQIGYKPVKVARVGKSRSRVPKPLPGAPSHWKRTIKALFWWLVIVVLVSALVGYFVEVLA